MAARSHGSRPEVTVYLPADLVALLRSYVGDRKAGPLFPRTNGERIGVRQVGRRLEIWAERAGIERRSSPHSLRHSFAMAAYERTGDAEAANPQAPSDSRIADWGDG